MEQINNIQVVPCTSSDMLKPFRVHYSQNGTRKSWDFMQTHDSVSVLIFNTTCHCFILVKQFRPAAVYMCEWEKSQPEKVKEKVSEEAGKDASKGGANEPEADAAETETDNAEQDSGHIQDIPPASVGVTYELCARPVDKPDLSLEEIARQEVLEECGYDVPVTKLRRITSYRSGVGVTGAKQTMFYAEVSDENCVGVAEGSGQTSEGELVEVVKVPLHEAIRFAYDENIPKTMGVIFSFVWFHSNMSPKYKISTNV
ncbi:uridine diphosphate glucose pyrophosphatase NUDT14-like isoform X1 [Brienomyrus brachyistius]|uniref:uridine diphosphate glucose pyrophosphatase NUDT14-like isoform X1 n=1 Tax=Brienomyrus brachyistius TaxID=42636 RepID=UPI0020B3728F|nr:uridine diphosphate glucose pyrophosphatase NUDT14-like isoform X1 [Brienomyrus brachyistius]